MTTQAQSVSIGSSQFNSSGVLQVAGGGTGTTTSTGTGNVVLSASPTLTGTLTAATIAASADATINGVRVGLGGGANSFNTAVGGTAIGASNTGAYNTAVGYNVLLVNTSGASNTGVGFGPLVANTTGNLNAAFGQQALTSNTSGSSNTALGALALGLNTTASNNTAVGYQAGYNGTTATDYSAFFGYRAGFIATGAQNCFIGAGAGGSVTTGSLNTIIGSFSGDSGGLNISTASNYIVLSDGAGNPRLWMNGAGNTTLNRISGNNELVYANGGTAKWFLWNDSTNNNFTICPASFASGVYLTAAATSWAAYSDRRIKSNIEDIDYGLDSILALKPRRYTVTANEQNTIGFIAQELKEVIPEAVVGEEVPFDDADTPQERASKTMGITKDTIIPVLVKAIQEQQTIIESLTTRIAALEAK